MSVTNPVASARRFGAQSMTAPLHEALVKRPGAAFAAAFERPEHGFLRPVAMDVAEQEHAAFRDLLRGLGVTVHELDAESASPDLIYTFDPLLVTDRGAIALRSGKPSRVGEEALLEAWTATREIPTLGRIEAPGTVDGGDTFWLRPDLVCIGHSLRTNRAGIEQLGSLVGGDVYVFDVPYGNGPSECLHLLSLISPITDRLAVAYLPLLPTGLYELACDLGIELVAVPHDEFATLGANVLAVRPGVAVMVEGNPSTERALRDRGVEVHTYAAREIGLNGSGGPTCLTRPVLRA